MTTATRPESFEPYYEHIGRLCGFANEDHSGAEEACDLVCSYVETLGLSRRMRASSEPKWRVIAGLLHHDYQGAILLWWYRDRKRGIPPPFGLGTSEPLPLEPAGNT